MSDYGTLNASSTDEQSARLAMAKRLRESPIPDAELGHNLGLYLSRQALSRILFMEHLYRRVVDVHGVIMEFGVRWGQNLALFESLRGIHEPYNFNRTIIGFDTFEGFPSVHENDGSAAQEGAYGVPAGYEDELAAVLDFHESQSPVSHIRKYELVKGDATATVTGYLDAHPETIVALAYFDFDLYAPTKACLEAIRDRLTKGSIVAFDELNYAKFPGETIALREVFGLDRYAIRRSPLAPLCAYIEIQ